MSEFIHSYYRDFLELNIKNGELSNQEKINKSVNILKKEVDHLFNINQLVTGSEGFQWEIDTDYSVGEIVWYNGVCYRAKVLNKNIAPQIGEIWEVITRGNYTLNVDPNLYLNINNTVSYTPVSDFNPATKKYVDDSLVNFNLSGLYLSTTEPQDFTPTDDFHPVTKKYMDESLADFTVNNEIIVMTSQKTLLLEDRNKNQFLQIDRIPYFEYVGMSVEESIAPWVRTTASGILPYDQNKGSSLGSRLWQFKEIHSVDFYGKYNSAQADLAEKYVPDGDYDEGTVLGIGGEFEVTLYKPSMPLAGVVSINPAVKMNSEIDGVYVALKGRVPVKIMGSAKKGQYINAYKDGCGIASSKKTDFTIGVALADGTHVVEVKI